MKIAKRITASVLCAVMLISVLPLTAFAAYENTHTNTGNQIEDLIAVATTQIGYTEGNSTAGHGGTTGGSGNYTKYGAWYGINPGAWCAMFVSWCSNQAGISSSIIPKHASCDIGMQWFQNNSRWQWSKSCGGSYTPKRGDIIYFRTNTAQVTDSTHVGIIYSCDGSTVYTIEGNASNKCQKKSYSLTSAYILGYGVPNYSSGTAYPTGQYKVTASSLNMRDYATTDSSVSTVLQSLPNGAVVDITLVYANTWGYCTYNGISGWIHLGYTTYVGESSSSTSTYTITFDANGGTQTSGDSEYPITTGAKYSDVMSSVPTATRSGYTFGGWYNEEYNFTLSQNNIGETFTVSEDVTFVAQWTALLGVYTITTNSDPLNMREGAGSSYETVGQVPKGTQVNITTIYGDWGFCTYNGTSGWVSLAYCTYYGPYTSSDDDVKTYTLTLDPNGGTMPSGVPTTYEFEEGELLADVIPVLPAPTKEGYEFKYWYWDKAGVNTSDYKWSDTWGTQAYSFWNYPTNNDIIDATFIAAWEKHTHSYSSTVTKAATCTSAGTRTYTCDCGDSYTASITKLSHSYTSAVTKQPTCSAEGVTTYTCSSCGVSYTEPISTTDHTYTSSVTKQPTCTAAGVTTYTCTGCNGSYTASIAALGHDYVDHAAQTPTCEAVGWDAYQTCSRCDYTTYKQIPAGAHGYTYSNGKVSCGGCGLGYNGFFTGDDNTYYCVDGTPKTGLFELDGDIYYASSTGALTKGTVVVITAAEKGSILSGSDSPYTFASDGKLVKTGFVNYSEVTYYYIDTVMATGLTKIDNDYYYFDGTTGAMLTDTTINIGNNSYGLEAGSYLVRPDGKLYFSGVQATLDGDKIYVDGVMQTNGLFSIGGEYYYATEDGTIAKSGARFVYYTNGLMPRAYYYFEADGSVMDTGWLDLEDGRSYYFKGKAHCKGLTEINGEYYFFNLETAELIRSADIWVEASYGMNAGVYSFDANGKLVTASTNAASEASVLNGATAVASTGYATLADVYVDNVTVEVVDAPIPTLPASTSGDEGDE